ncbi:MAG: hypothetical protein H0W72_04180 [Planctomycetes bacterium]|nr:hypothetical protein [Planctomycetota bacterium]
MRTIWKGIHEHGRAVDQALEQCMHALGTPDFPMRLADYHEAARRLCALRVDLVIEQERQRRRQAQMATTHVLRRVADGE